MIEWANDTLHAPFCQLVSCGAVSQPTAGQMKIGGRPDPVTQLQVLIVNTFFAPGWLRSQVAPGESGEQTRRALAALNLRAERTVADSPHYSAELAFSIRFF